MSNISPPAKKKSHGATIYSQPADTGVGRYLQTQLLFAVNFLKNHGSPIRLEDLAITSNVEGLLTNAELLNMFHGHERVIVDDKTGLYSYKVRSWERARGDGLQNELCIDC